MIEWPRCSGLYTDSAPDVPDLATDRSTCRTPRTLPSPSSASAPGSSGSMACTSVGEPGHDVEDRRSAAKRALREKAPSMGGEKEQTATCATHYDLPGERPGEPLVERTDDERTRSAKVSGMANARRLQRQATKEPHTATARSHGNCATRIPSCQSVESSRQAGGPEACVVVMPREHAHVKPRFPFLPRRRMAC